MDENNTTNSCNKNCDCEHKKTKNSKADKYILQIKELEEEVLRSKADLINYRKRKDEEVSSLLRYSNGDILENLLPVIDNFERAISLDESSLSDEVKQFLNGFKLIYVNLKSILEAYGVKEIDCLGKDFDSNFHQAVLTDSNKEYKDGIILEVMLKGYTYKDKILRYASVKVNRV